MCVPLWQHMCIGSSPCFGSWCWLHQWGAVSLPQCGPSQQLVPEEKYRVETERMHGEEKGWKCKQHHYMQTKSHTVQARLGSALCFSRLSTIWVWPYPLATYNEVRPSCVIEKTTHLQKWVVQVSQNAEYNTSICSSQLLQWVSL